MTMMVWVLAAWALGGDVSCEKVSEKCLACCRALRKSSVTQEMDWVEYYRRNGSQINGSGYGGGRVNISPVFVSPSMQWAVPNSALSGPPTGPYPYGPYPNQ